MTPARRARSVAVRPHSARASAASRPTGAAAGVPESPARSRSRASGAAPGREASRRHGVGRFCPEPHFGRAPRQPLADRSLQGFAHRLCGRHGGRTGRDARRQQIGRRRKPTGRHGGVVLLGEPVGFLPVPPSPHTEPDDQTRPPVRRIRRAAPSRRTAPRDGQPRRTVSRASARRPAAPRAAVDGSPAAAPGAPIHRPVGPARPHPATSVDTGARRTSAGPPGPSTRPADAAPDAHAALLPSGASPTTAPPPTVSPACGQGRRSCRLRCAHNPHGPPQPRPFRTPPARRQPRPGPVCSSTCSGRAPSGCRAQAEYWQPREKYRRRPGARQLGTEVIPLITLGAKGALQPIQSGGQSRPRSTATRQHAASPDNPSAPGCRAASASAPGTSPPNRAAASTCACAPPRPPASRAADSSASPGWRPARTSPASAPHSAITAAPRASRAFRASRARRTRRSSGTPATPAASGRAEAPSTAISTPPTTDHHSVGNRRTRAKARFQRGGPIPAVGPPSANSDRARRAPLPEPLISQAAAPAHAGPTASDI